MRRADFVIGLGLLAFAGFYYQRSFDITVGLASDRLGPTFFPRLLAGALAFCALALVLRSARGRSDPGPLPPVRLGLLATTIVLTVAYGALLPALGYLIATPIFLGAIIWVTGHRHAAGAAAVSLGITAVLFLVFARALKVLVPMGPLTGR